MVTANALTVNRNNYDGGGSQYTVYYIHVYNATKLVYEILLY